MSDEQLKEARAKLDEELKRRAAVKRAEARRKILELAAEHGIDAAELISKGDQKGAYCNPDNPWQTWSGRGRKPGWVQKWLDAGNSLDKLPRA